ncbi:MAG: heme-binding protein [Bacteroidetes bacterium]|nr:heme-binding protein [Bacteroidota bacterium]
MKTSLIIIGIVLLVFMAIQVWASMSTNKTEQYKYAVLKANKSFEIRKYEKAVFARTQIDAETYRAGSGNGFRTLASYIFGGNERNESIAMTSPVAMSWDKGMTMEFMMPSKYTLESLPNPNRTDIVLYEKPAVVMAAISFGGFASDQKIQEKIAELKAILDQAGIAHTGQFQYMGYNPPYQMINRRNDIVVELIDWEE